MKLDNLIMELHINIGTPKACLFVFMSKRLLNKLRQHTLLYYAVEEALISAKNSYYSIGIIVWYELLKSVLHANSKIDANKRNVLAHNILRDRPTKEDYDGLLEKFKSESKKCYLKEIAKTKNKEAYISELYKEWGGFMKDVKGLSSIV